MVDTACWTAATDTLACLLAVSTTATTPDRSIPAGRSSGQTPSGRAPTQDRSAARTPGAPRRHGRVSPPPRPLAAGGTPPSSWRLGAPLSSDDFGSSVERAALGQVLWRVHLRAGAAVFSVWCWICIGCGRDGLAAPSRMSAIAVLRWADLLVLLTGIPSGAAVVQTIRPNWCKLPLPLLERGAGGLQVCLPARLGGC